MDLSLSLTLPIQKKRRKRKSFHPPPPFPPSQPPEDGYDRFTPLPDPLRLEILSMLPLSDAIRTGGLSTQWKNLWKTRHHNRIQSYIRINVPSNHSPTPSLRHISKLFKDRNRLYHSLHISLLPDTHHLSDILHVLHSAANYGVEDLSIDLRSCSVSFRRPLFSLYLTENFSSLIRLCLSGFRLSPIPYHFHTLSNLESLSLHKLNMTDSIFAMLLAYCPMLRSLDVRQCPDLKKLVAVEQRIVNVTIVECRNLVEIRVSVKCLKKFHFKGEFVSVFWFKGLECLEDVYLCCDGPGCGFPTTNFVKEIGSLHHVRVLTLCSVSLQYIMAADATVFQKYQVFQCLKELQLLMISLTFEDLMVIYKFFRLCQFPTLERLFIELPTTMHDPYVENLMQVAMEDPTTSVFRNLKTIKINGFKCHQDEKRMVRFFLSNSLNLESLIVVAPRGNAGETKWSMWDSHCHLLQLCRIEFSRIPTFSANAKIVVSEHDDSSVKPAHEAHCKV